MYFFKVTLSSFDDEKKVFFIFPDSQPFDTIEETPVFSENDLCVHPAFKQYVKNTKTTIVDVSYQLYHIRDFSIKKSDSTDIDKQLEQLIEEKLATIVDYNDISIIPGKHKASSRNSNNSMYVVFFAMIAFVVIFLIVGLISSKTNGNAESSEISEIEEISSEISSNSQEG